MILTTLATIETVLTLPNIVFVIGILATIFGIYSYFRKPQEDLEKKQIIIDNEINTKATVLAANEMENKAKLLAQQVEWEKCANEKKFAEFGIRLDNSFLLAANHVNTVDTKVDKLCESVNSMKIEMSNQITRLGVIIEERLPKKE